MTGEFAAIDIPSSVQVEGNSLVIPDNLKFKDYERIGKSLGKVCDFSQTRLPFLIGDWINFGMDKFPDIYEQALEFTSLNPGTLYNYAWTCRKVPSFVRKDALGIGIHQEVAKLTSTEEQRRWLADAEINGWSRTDLRKAMNGQKIGPALPKRVRPWEEIEKARAAKENPRPIRTFEEWYDENEERLAVSVSEHAAYRIVWSAAQEEIGYHAEEKQEG